MATTETAPSLADILEARERLVGIARETPVYGSGTLSRATGREVFLKAENLQRTGAFKVRGAVNRIATMSAEQRAAGVVAASAGNHGQAVAWAARQAGIPARIYVPQDAPMAKVEACRTYGAELIMGGAGFEEALSAAMAYVEETGATFVHPFEDPTVIAGQGTIGLELADQVPNAETVVIPVGGGGLASGIALALRANRPNLRIVGVQAGLSGFTIADGVFVKRPGELTMSILDDVLDDMVDVDDESISEGIVLLLERTKLVVEGAGAVGVAALRSGKVGGSGPVVIVLSGGNIDPTLLITIMRHGLTLGGRYLVIRTRIPDRPGELVRLLTLIAEARGNVVSVEHHREGMELPVAETEVELTLITRDQEHCTVLLDKMRSWGYAVERLK
ncbi:MAG TPA: pyridoxal-phosphate dependent enzyme [Gaiellaceae bacterium]|nr:pyridoxal-phosphate dependent enzyme [Gaiellaceae bacterium]